MNVFLEPALQARIFRQMEAGYPNESGGFLLGTPNGDSIRVADTIPVENVFAAEEQYHRYAMNPQDWARLEDRADALGLSLVGYYHSHPDWPAIPSDYDRDHALPNFIYIITSVQTGSAVDMRVWQLNSDRAAFREETLVVEPSKPA